MTGIRTPNRPLPPQTLGDGVLFEEGITVWTGAHLDKYLNLRPPIPKDTSGARVEWLEEGAEWLSQWLLTSRWGGGMALSLLYSTREAALRALLQECEARFHQELAVIEEALRNEQ